MNSTMIVNLNLHPAQIIMVEKNIIPYYIALVITNL